MYTGWLTRRRAVACIAALITGVGTRRATAQTVTWTGALQGSSGDYGLGERTNSLTLSNGFTISADRLRLSASLPLVYQSSPWVTQVGAGRFPYGGPHHASTGDSSHMGTGSRHGGGGMGVPDTGSFTQIGVGDPTLFTSVELLPSARARTSLSVTGAVKAPLGSVRDGFSTGEWDYGGGLALTMGAGRTLLLLDAMYWVLGDMRGLALEDGVSYGAALGTTVGERRISLLASLAGSTRMIEGVSAPVQLGFAVGHLSSGRRSINAGVYIGLTDSAPDLSVSLGWGVPLLRR